MCQNYRVDNGCQVGVLRVAHLIQLKRASTEPTQYKPLVLHWHLNINIPGRQEPPHMVGYKLKYIDMFCLTKITTTKLMLLLIFPMNRQKQQTYSSVDLPLNRKIERTRWLVSCYFNNDPGIKHLYLGKRSLRPQ